MADEAVAAIENSLEGSVTDTLDLLIHESKLRICYEMVLPIEHHLLTKPDTRVQEVKLIFSQPQSLAQCRHFLERCFPQASMVAALSNSAAVEQMMASPTPTAAIGPQRAATLYGARIAARNIQDRTPNVTRFVVLAAEDHPPTGRDKTSLCFSFSQDQPGLLFGVLREFADRNINLAKVESRPSKESLGQYIFLIDFEGHRKDPLVAEMLGKVSSKVSMLKVFGSYPRYKAQTLNPPSGSQPPGASNV